MANLIELEDSFPTESSAWKFGEYLKARIGVTLGSVAVSRLVTHTGHVTIWWRLAIPARHVKRAEDLRDAWRAALNLAGVSEVSL